MTLIVEDGTNVPGANTYIDDAFFTAYADARGESYPTTPAEREILIIKAMDYVESFRARYQGTKSYQDGSTQWPRINVYIDDYPFPSNQIPIELQDAQAQAAVEVQTQELQQNTGKDVKREKVDVIEVEYNSGGSLNQPIFKKVQDLLRPLFKGTFSSVMPIR